MTETAPRKAQLLLVDLDPLQPPPGAPVVECVLRRSRVRVRVLSAGEGVPVEPGAWCAFPESKRQAGARFAVGKLTLIRRKRRSYYRAGGPYWLVRRGGTP